jgi:DNA-binding transcriptional MerR regulator
MKKRRRNQARKYRQPRDDRAQVVKELAAAGMSGDVIAAALAIGKNRLRAEHALDLHSGRTAKVEAAKAAAATALSKEDAERLARIEASFQSEWFSEEFGNDLYGGARNVAEAQSWLASFKSARKPNEDSDG